MKSGASFNDESCAAAVREREKDRRLRRRCADFREVRERVFKSVSSYAFTPFPWHVRDDTADISSADGFPATNLISFPVVAEDFRNACFFVCGSRAVLRVNRSVYIKFNDLKKGSRILLAKSGKITVFLDGTKNTIRVPVARVAILPRAASESNSSGNEFVEISATAT